VISFRLLDGLKIGRPRRPCGSEEGAIKRIALQGAEHGAVGLPKHRQELRPPGLGPVGHPLHRGVQRELGRDSA